MDHLVLIAGAIPLVIIVAVVMVFATVRYSMTETHLRLSILGFRFRNVPYEDITSVEYIPPGHAPGWGVFRRGGVVVVEYEGPSGKGAMTVSTVDAEGMSMRLKDTVSEQTGREV